VNKRGASLKNVQVNCECFAAQRDSLSAVCRDGEYSSSEEREVIRSFDFSFQKSFLLRETLSFFSIMNVSVTPGNSIAVGIVSAVRAGIA
jgi:hypothetical protein